MRVLVLGSGVVGVTSAWYLTEAGHEVTVLERQPGAGLETSFANAGQVSPGLSAPWAGPETPLKALKWLLMHHGPLVLRPLPDPALLAWIFRFLGNCTAAAYARNKARMVRLADYSRDRLDDLRDLTGIDYDGRQLGLLQIFREAHQLESVRADMRVLAELGVPHALLDRAGCIAQEPALANSAAKIAGGLHLPSDQSGDAHLFTTRLAAMAASQGVDFRYDVTIERLLTEGDRISGVMTDQGVFRADAYLCCLGSYGPAILRAVGVHLPVYPVKGYSITVPLENELCAPRSTIMDETYKIAITRLGDRIRVGGTAELAGFSTKLRDGRRETLSFTVNDLFPGAGDTDKATFWTGLRPMTPDGAPVIGREKYQNLWLNTGHGTLGWTMSCGSGALIADLISGKRPNIAHEDLTLARYQR